MKCFYHSSDFDGKCSGFLVLSVFPRCEMFPINYGDKFPWDKIKPKELVFMVDFSLQPFEDMVKLVNMSNLIWIDHHKTAIDSYNLLDNDTKNKIKTVLVEGIGACQSVYKYFYSTEPLEYVKHLALYDVWNHSDPKTLPFQYGMRFEDPDPEDELWKELHNNEKTFNKILEKGKFILEYENRQNKLRASSLSFPAKIKGYNSNFIAINYGPTNSKVFDSVWDPEKYDGMLTFQYKPKGFYTVSLYTEKKDVDLSIIAKNFGGGGHRNACGFQCNNIFDIIELQK